MAQGAASVAPGAAGVAQGAAGAAQGVPGAAQGAAGAAGVAGTGVGAGYGAGAGAGSGYGTAGIAGAAPAAATAAATVASTTAVAAATGISTLAKVLIGIAAAAAVAVGGIIGVPLLIGNDPAPETSPDMRRVDITEDVNNQTGTGATDALSRTGFSTIAADRSFHVGAITADGYLYTWGYSRYALGHDNTVEAPFFDGDGLQISLSPTRVQGISDVVSISLGSTSAAITADGNLFTWGHNATGDLALGHTSTETVPTRVAGLSNVVNVCVFGANAAVTAEGYLYTWGFGTAVFGVEPNARSINNEPYLDTITRVPGISNVISVNTASDAAAITADGSLYTWLDGQPTRVQGLYDVVAVSVSEGDSFAAITAGGSLYTWGYNNNGQLGLGHTDYVDAPTRVPLLSGVVAVSIGDSHAAAVTIDGSLYTWGDDDYFALGLGSSDRAWDAEDYIVPTPTRVPGLERVVDVRVSNNQTFALTIDGSLYAWGHDSMGRLGTGAIITSNPSFIYYPNKIMDNVQVP
jgi:alpha-tubulin suppressor-like RCC1 family protein